MILNTAVFAIQNQRSILHIYGTEEISKKTIEKMLGQNGIILPDSIDVINKRIRSLYFNNGFFQFNIDSALVRDGNIFIFINEGKRAKFGRIDLVYPEIKRMEEIENKFPALSGRYFSSNVLKEFIMSLLAEMEQHGYPTANLEITSLYVRQNKGDLFVDCVLTLIPGSVIKFASQKVKGNNITKEKVILRETKIKRGDVFDEEKVKKAAESLKRLGFFEFVKEPLIIISGDSAEILWYVKEGKTSTIDGVMGYNPPQNNRENGYVTGRLQFTFQNFLGTGRFINLFWEKKDRLTQVMDFRFEEPWILGVPFSLGFSFKQEIRDSTYVERRFQLNAKYSPFSTLSLSVSGGTKDVFPDSAGVIYNHIPRTSSVFIDGGFKYNTLNNAYNPKSGVMYRINFSAGKRKILGPDFLADTSLIGNYSVYKKISADIETVFNLHKKHVLFFSFHHKSIDYGDNFIPISDQIRFGGSTTLRGYDEDAFLCNSVAWLNAEYRFITGLKSRLFLFTDAGMYQRKEKDGSEVRNFVMGYGAGIRVETPLGVIGVDYGLAKGNSFSQGKIHIRVINIF